MPKRTLATDQTEMRVVIVTLDAHLASAAEQAERLLGTADLSGLKLSLHAASEWGSDAVALEHCKKDIQHGDIIIVTMMFLEEHINAILPDLQARRDDCDAMVCCMSAGEIIKLTRLGKFNMGAKESVAIGWLKKLRGSRSAGQSSGEKQMAMLRRIPKFLKYIPGTAQDVRAYFLAMQCWMACSDENLATLVRDLINRYANGPRRHLRGKLSSIAPLEYPDVGVYHPTLKKRVSAKRKHLPKQKDAIGTVGLLVMRSYVLAGNTGHYDAVIKRLEAQGFNVITAFASGLDSRPAIKEFFLKDGQSRIDALVSLTGFSLVGGPAYNDSQAAEEMLAELDIPYLSAQALEFQSIEQWEKSERGLLPLEATMMVAIPELDGATGSMVFGGRSEEIGSDNSRDMHAHPERVETLVGRVSKLVELRKTRLAERRAAIVLFNFPPNSGAVGSAAFLDVFCSLHNTLKAMRAAGYDTGELPETPDELRDALLKGNAESYGADANVCAEITVDDYITREPHLSEIEAEWGPAPGQVQADSSAIWVLGLRFKNVLVAVQPGFGYEGDPMRLLLDNGLAPTHAFSAFYRYIREDFAAHTCLHFGTHGALEFMPGKQAGMSSVCWPDRLIGDLPNNYLYAANNPSEGTLAKRRSAATLISYLTPPITEAGLYNELEDLKSSLERWQIADDETRNNDQMLIKLIRDQAIGLDMLCDSGPSAAFGAQDIAAIWDKVSEIETSLIPCGLHTVGETPDVEQRRELMQAILKVDESAVAVETSIIDAVLAGDDLPSITKQFQVEVESDLANRIAKIHHVNASLQEDHEIGGLLKALDGGFIRPVAGGDVTQNSDILPTGRNLHGFDPFRIPSAFAVADGARQAQRLIDSHMERGNEFPECMAIVLWGTDNLKTGGGPIAQALSLLGAEPRFDSYGRLCGAQLVALEELGRPRIDVVMTVSGIFRDLLPLQIKVLAEACLLAATADEPETENFVRKHALAYQQTHGCDIETAALRVFSNADGAYGSNVNYLIDNALWSDEDELAETFTQRKCFAYSATGESQKQPELFSAVLSNIDLAYQNLESTELGVTTIDHYFDTLGGISRTAQRTKAGGVPIYISDQTQGTGRVATLQEQVALETRTRMLNPKWYEGLLEHGYEGVRSIEAHLKNTVGWSATTGQVDSWVYEEITNTFILDPAMRERLATLNPESSARFANRLLEAHERNYWKPDAATLAALQEAGDEFEDRLEGVIEGVAA